MKMHTFDFNEHAVRVLSREDGPWFVAVDVCRVLEIANSRDAVAGLDDDEKGVGNTDTLGGPQKMALISESGLYALIFKSRKPEAKRFRKWVTAEVLPMIRQSGGYGEPVKARNELAEIRELLITSARAVRDKLLDVGRAQQIANLAARYLETVKLEGDALGYEAVFGLRGSEVSGGLLRKKNVVQELPQQEVQGLPKADAWIPPAAICDQEKVGTAEPGAGEAIPREDAH